MNHASSVVKGTARPQPSPAPYSQGMPRPPAQPAPKSSPVGFQFVAIPAQLMREGNLSLGALLLFGVIADAARQSRIGSCRLANATLGERIGRSESEVGRYILELESAGLVAREYAGRAKFVRLGIRITWVEPAPEKSTPAQVPGSAGPGHGTSGGSSADPRAAGTQIPGPIQTASQNERSEAGAPLPGREDQPIDPKAGADFLRRCVAAARRGEPMPEPPAGVTATKGVTANHHLPPASDKFDTAPAPTVSIIDTLPRTPPAGPDATTGAVRSMIASLGARLALDDLRPSKRRRR